jgi:hypothetical protein
VDSEFRRHEQLIEYDYVNRSEREFLNNLLDKMKAFTAPAGPESMQALTSLLTKHKVPITDEIKQDFVMWKTANKGANEAWPSNKEEFNQIDERLRP